jgi:hypothetical protein
MLTSGRPLRVTKRRSLRPRAGCELGVAEHLVSLFVEQERWLGSAHGELRRSGGLSTYVRYNIVGDTWLEGTLFHRWHDTVRVTAFLQRVPTSAEVGQ